VTVTAFVLSPPIAVCSTDGSDRGQRVELPRPKSFDHRGVEAVAGRPETHQASALVVPCRPGQRP
jgi:hypothetical protein